MTEQTVDRLAGSEGASRSQWGDVWHQFKRHRGALIGAITFLAIIAAVYLGPLVWTTDPQYVPPTVEMIKARDFRPIYVALVDSTAKTSWAHPLGTDNLARDQLARLMSGGQISIAVGLAAMIVSIVVGTFVGVVAGYSRMLDGPLMRFTDLMLSLPLLPLSLVAVLLFRESLAARFGPEGGIFVLIVGLVGFTSWMQTARIVRGDVLALKEREFVLAARSIGTKDSKMITRHILPNVMSPIMVSATLGIAAAIITESALSFLGLGFPPDFPTWGKLLSDSVDRMVLYPERVIWPGALISVTVLAVNYMGDGIRDALDPRIRGR
ncbi:Oligopeptide transport system permease protein OppC [Candidatus Rhodobacter oscarellae]|uniref:Oligopeptide transport system permease protein OppC n=1 Tax=Candidatus Rhodobacter oscarellae TaxID=1675527 RepID=A0A0J9E0V4_9RHOB|nr:ABC transporter permease [Candidatus Rhodobacter lobularis]KMW56355.1 Oligopeptide transport system permease protein OppC [Candidatus Rhodobacter lobularis]